MQKPNVLFISSWYPSKEHPTLGNFVQRHAEAINPFVNLFVVYVTSSSTIDKEFEITHSQINGVNTTIVYYKKVTSKTPFFSSYKKLKRYRIGYELGIEEVMRKHRIKKFDITHCNVTFPVGLIALDLKKKFNLPYVLTEHWTLFLPYTNDFDKLSPLIKNQLKKITKEASVISPVSQHLANSMQKRGLGGNYQIIPNVSDVDLFKLKHKSEGDVKRILHVSTLVDDHKNITGIFRTLKSISEKRQDFKLVIVSDGDIDSTKKIQAEIGLTDQFVEYHGTKTPQEIAEDYRNSDFFLLFSNYENLPVVMVESFCCGLPFVSSNVGGISEYVTTKNGLLVEPRDEEALEKALINTLDNIEAYKSEEIRALAVQQFDNKVIGKQYLELYKTIIS